MASKKTTEPPKRAFIKTLEQIAHRHHITQVFDDFMEIAICALSLGRMEERYFELIKRYSRDELTKFQECFAHMFSEYDRAAQDGGWDDMLGIYFEEIGSLSGKQAMGQFFTPKCICDLMAQLNHDPKSPVPNGTTVADHAAGSSRNLIAHARLHPQNRWNSFYHAYDLDRRCVNMSVLNMVMYGMKGVAIHMNTLSLEVYSGYRVYLPETGLGITRLTEQQCWAYMTERREQEATISKMETTTDGNECPSVAAPDQPKVITIPDYKSLLGNPLFQQSLF